jgi:hypothetical protein
MVLSQQSKAKWRSTAVASFTPKELGEPSAAHSEVSQMSMKSVFLLQLVDGSPNSLGVKMPLHLKTQETENKKRTWRRVQ